MTQEELREYSEALDALQAATKVAASVTELLFKDKNELPMLIQSEKDHQQQYEQGLQIVREVNRRIDLVKEEQLELAQKRLVLTVTADKFKSLKPIVTKVAEFREKLKQNGPHPFALGAQRFHEMMLQQEECEPIQCTFLVSEREFQELQNIGVLEKRDQQPF
jgi:hypothetical protein